MKHMPRKHTPAFLAKVARRQQRRALNQTPARHKREMDRQLVDARKEISKGCANVAYLLDKYRLLSRARILDEIAFHHIGTLEDMEFRDACEV